MLRQESLAGWTARMFAKFAGVVAACAILAYCVTGCAGSPLHQCWKHSDGAHKIECAKMFLPIIGPSVASQPEREAGDEGGNGNR